MTYQLVLYLLTCGPLVILLVACMKLYWVRQRYRLNALGFVALGLVSANAALAASTFLYYQLKRVRSSLPPWEDPEILTLALLALFAPIGMIVGAMASAHGSPKWLICVLEIASVPLLLVGFMAGITV
jgi:hypothetical protein